MTDESDAVSAYGSGLALGAFFGFATTALHSVVEFGLHIPAIAVLATVLCAYMCALGGGEGRPAQPGRAGVREGAVAGQVRRPRRRDRGCRRGCCHFGGRNGSAALDQLQRDSELSLLVVLSELLDDGKEAILDPLQYKSVGSLNH